MAQRPSRSLVGRVRGNPAGCLSGLAMVSLQVVAMGLSLTNLISSSVDATRTALAQAFGMLGMPFLLVLVWTTSLSEERNDAGAEDIVATSGRNQWMRLSTRARRVAFCVWVVILVLALAQLVAALSGNPDVSYPLGMAVAGLSLIALVGGLVAVAGRQR